MLPLPCRFRSQHPNCPTFRKRYSFATPLPLLHVVLLRNTDRPIMLSARSLLPLRHKFLCRNLVVVGGGWNRNDIPSVHMNVTAKRYAHQGGGFALTSAGRRSRDQATQPTIVHQSILLESKMILTHLQQQHADFLSLHSLSHLQIHPDGTFALSSRDRGWKIWCVAADRSPSLDKCVDEHVAFSVSRRIEPSDSSYISSILLCALPHLFAWGSVLKTNTHTHRSHQDAHKKQQWLLVHTAGIFSQFLLPNKSDQQKTRIENKVDMFVRRLEQFGK